MKTLKIIALLVTLSTISLGCKENKSGEAQTENQAEEHMAADKADIAMNDVYQCPMDCEDGKTYEEPGSCPVCAMDLKKVEKDADEDGGAHDDHEEEHSDEHN